MLLRKPYPTLISFRLPLEMFVLVLITAVFQTGCGLVNDLSSSSSAPTVTSVSISCSPTSVQSGQTSQCSATVTGTGSYNSSVTWSASAGTINSSGLFTAPAAAATVTVTATSTEDTSKSGNTSVTVTTAPPTITSVSVSCSPPSVETGQTSQCAATVTGTGSYSSAVNWSVDDIQGGNSTAGTISISGLYTAPSAVPSTNPVTVTATSVADTTQYGSASVTVTAAPASGASAGTTDANGLVTLSSGGITVPLQLVDSSTNQPIQGMNVALGTPSSPVGLVVLFLDDPLNQYPIQFITLQAPPSDSASSLKRRRSRPLSVPMQQGSGSPTTVGANIGCSSDIPATATVSAPISSIDVPPPPPGTTISQQSQGVFDAATNAMQNFASQRGISFNSTGEQLAVQGGQCLVAAAPVVTAFLGGGLPTALGMVGTGAELVEAAGIIEVPEWFGLSIKTADAWSDIQSTLSSCPAWIVNLGIKGIQLGAQQIVLMVAGGTPPDQSTFVSQFLGTQSQAGAPLDSTTCILSDDTFGNGSFVVSSDGSGTAELPADTYTTETTSNGYVPVPGGFSLSASNQGQPIDVTMSPITSPNLGANVTYVEAIVSCTNSGGFFDNCAGNVSLNIGIGIENGELAVAMDQASFTGGISYSPGAVPGTVNVSLSGGIVQGSCVTGTTYTDIQVYDGFVNSSSTYTQIGSSSSVPLAISCGPGT